MLAVENVWASYGHVEALKDVSLQVNPGTIVALLGANGAGKSTLLKVVTGLLAPTAGSVRYRDSLITGLRADRIVRKGISMVPEGRDLFLEMTVEENLEMGAVTRSDVRGIRGDMDEAFTLFPRLGERRLQLAGTLSGGEQQMLAIARALMARPSLLLLDEPSLGLAPAVVNEILATIERVNGQGTGILLVEQNAQAALESAHFGYVLQNGRVTLSGTSQALLADASIQESYLGRDWR